MKVIWEYSPRLEALRLIQCARNIAIGFYRYNGFVVLPKTSSVVFPKLNFLSIPRFWDKVKKLNTVTYPFEAPTSLVNAVQNLMPISNFRQFKIPKTVFTEIFRIVPKFKNIQELIIMPTNYGTSCSFSTNPETGKIYIWLRNDSTLIHIVEAILSALTRTELQQILQADWGESEIVVDYLIYSSATFKKLDPNWKSALTLSTIRNKQNGNQKQQSDQYITSLGCPLVSTESLRDLNSNKFPAHQQKIFKLLLEKSPQIVSADEIYEHLYPGNPENFSLYAIAKQIQRLRDLLERHGISGSFIQTKRGVGYFLVN